jgi:NAD+ synthase (glutamine-hydrolysing)
MVASVRIALAQANFLVGDVDGNADKVISLAVKARDELAADAIVFPELTLTGYPPEDLLLRRGLYEQVEEGLARIVDKTAGIDVIVGYPLRQEDRHYNAASLIRDGKIASVYFKHALPNYAVFDEKRYFSEGKEACTVEIGGIRFALTICEDVWETEPIEKAVRAGAQIILNLNASPYHLNKYRLRQQQVADQVARHKVPIVYVNLVGGQDELVFDGNSFVIDAQGSVTQRLPAFTESLAICEVNASGAILEGEIAPELSDEESVYQALVLGVRDYVGKNRFPGVVVGLSGGVDSALTLAIAVDALGAENVEAIMMPSPFTSQMSLEDAAAVATNLAVAYSSINIGPLVDAYNQALAERFHGLPKDVTEENIQARIRGNLLMAVSNKTGRMVLTTGNKSEMAVGYATLYGDMAGGFAAIKDVPKTLVYRLSRYRNSIAPVIPERILTRPPSAELAPDQKDTDTLPPYDILDGILERYVERDETLQEIIAVGYDAATVERVASMVDRNEYKRRQAAPGVRITPRAFGRDRRYPVTSGFRSRH